MLILGKDEIDVAADFIKKGELISFPTETVYGLGADATNSEAVKKIFEAKGRPNFNPLIAHVCDIEMAQEIAEFNDMALRAAMSFWPGPLTLILKKKNNKCDAITAGLDTIGVRIPSNEVALDLIKKSGVPIAAPSANKSGLPSPTKAIHVINSYKNNEVAGVLDGGATEVGLESTILDLSADKPTLLRYGYITKEYIEGILVTEVEESVKEDKDGKVKSPGQLLRHYAPRLPVKLNVTEVMENEALLAFGETDLQGKRTLNLSKRGDLKEAARNFFAMMIELDDKEEFSGIAVTPVPNEGIGKAINDKLKRSCVK